MGEIWFYARFIEEISGDRGIAQYGLEYVENPLDIVSCFRKGKKEVYQNAINLFKSLFTDSKEYKGLHPTQRSFIVHHTECNRKEYNKSIEQFRKIGGVKISEGRSLGDVLSDLDIMLILTIGKEK